MSKIAPAIAGLAIALSVGAAHAQLFGLGGGNRGGEINQFPAGGGDSLDPSMCDQLATIPNAPMSAEACRSMMGMQKSMQSASSDPSAVRPGDESLTCDQIMTEMQVTGGPMMSQETVAQNKASADATLALMEKQNAEMKGFVAGQVAMGIGAAAVGMLPGGGFATQAIMAAQQAQTKSFADKQAKEAAPVRAQMNQSLTATGNELGQALQSNPRYARLMQLVVDKNCPAPKGQGQ
jgi:hypothetical protein